MTGAYEPTVHVEAAFGNGPYDVLDGTEWVALTSRFIRGRFALANRTSELDAFTAGTASIELDDSGANGRQLDPLNAASTYNGLLVPDVPVRAFASLTPTVDTFTGSDGATPTGWTDSGVSGAGASVGINANRLRFVTGTTTYGLGRIRYSTAVPVDLELQCTVDIQALSEQYVNVYVRCGSSFVANQLASGYAAVVDVAANLLAIYEIDAAGATTQIASAAVTWTAAIWNVKVRALGPWITAKAWTTTEPTAWQVGVADTTSAGTSTGLRVTGGNNTVSDTIYVDNFTITELRPIWSGYADDWEPQWSKDIGQTLLTATDASKILGRKRLPQSVYEAEVLADAPHFYWKLGEATGNVAADSSGNTNDGAYGSGVLAERASDNLVDHDAAGAIKISGTAAVLSTTPPPVAAVTGGTTARVATEPRTLEMWLKSDGELATGASANVYGLFKLGDSATANNRITSYYQRAVSASDDKEIWVWSGGNRSSWAPSTQLDNSLPHHLVIVMSGGNKTLYIDGEAVVQEGTAVDSPGTPIGNAVYLGVSPDAGAINNQWIGWMGHVALYDTALTAAQVADHYEAATAPWEGDTTGTRIGRVLDEINWPTYLRALDPGEIVLGPADLAGRTTLDYLQPTAVSDSWRARLFPDAHGRVTFHDGGRFQREAVETTSQATFSDDGANGSILYEPNIRFRRSFREVTDEAVVTRDGGSPQTATASGVTDPVNARSVTGLLLRDDRQARNYAEAIVARFSTARTRVSAWRTQPEVDMRSGVGWSTLLALGIGHRVTVEGKPGNIGAQIVLDVHLERIEHTIEPETWHMDFAGSPVDTTNYFVWGGNGATQGWSQGVWR